jgi:hypothetical protein
MTTPAAGSTVSRRSKGMVSLATKITNAALQGATGDGIGWPAGVGFVEITVPDARPSDIPKSVTLSPGNVYIQLGDIIVVSDASFAGDVPAHWKIAFEQTSGGSISNGGDQTFEWVVERK